MSAEILPRHVAVIMDGNGRWAKQRLLPRKLGHRAGAKAVRKLVESSARRGIQVLSLYAFSTENWQRPAEEVDSLMNLFFANLEKELPTLMDNHIRLKVIGDRLKLEENLQLRISEVEHKTQNNKGMTLVLAISYSGRWELIEAFKKIIREATDTKTLLEDLTEEKINQHLALPDFPAPDLIIRTSGEQRLSGFLLWQSAYAELYFTSILWPDFSEQDFDAALTFYQSRERRFGLTSEQLNQGA